jgi:hypothetical protein
MNEGNYDERIWTSYTTKSKILATALSGWGGG